MSKNSCEIVKRIKPRRGNGRVLIASALLVLASSGQAQAAPHWGEFKKDHCTKPGHRQYSAILWGIPWGKSWQAACDETPAQVNGTRFSKPTRCKNTRAAMWGEFDVPDPSCVAKGSVSTDLAAQTRGQLGGYGRLMRQAERSLKRFESQLRSGRKIEQLSDPELQAAAADEGFQSITISLVGDGSYILGVNGAPGVAHSLKDWSGLRGIVSVGLTIGTSISLDGELQLGFWKAPKDGLTGWLWGVGLGGHYYGGLSAAGYWDMAQPPKFQGFVVGLGPGFGVEGEIGLAATEYMDTIGGLAKDIGAVIGGGQTERGVELGGACRVGADCKGYRAPLGNAGGVACCNNRCVKTERDWAGVWWCPAECRKAPFAAPGSCG